MNPAGRLHQTQGKAEPPGIPGRFMLKAEDAHAGNASLTPWASASSGTSAKAPNMG
jgi:hypothetical protein